MTLKKKRTKKEQNQKQKKKNKQTKALKICPKKLTLKMFFVSQMSKIVPKSKTDNSSGSSKLL